jgi:thioesterase domain-containing protein
MTLAGWGLTAALLDGEAPGDLVAQTASVEFLLPVRGDFDIVAAMPSLRAVESFRRRYRRRGRSRLLLEVRVNVDGICHVRGEVRYAAIRHDDDANAGRGETNDSDANGRPAPAPGNAR